MLLLISLILRSNLSYGGLEKIQYQAALATTGCWQGSSRITLYEELGRESPSDRRWARRLVNFYKIFRKNSPFYFYEHISRQRIPIYGSRSPSILCEIKCRTSKYMNSFFPNCVRSWNNIGDELRNNEKISVFKTHLFSHIRPSKRDIYGIHNPTGIKHIFRLRLGLSLNKT